MKLAGLAGVLALASTLTGTAAARAEVVDSSPAGFEVLHAVQVAAPPDKVYAAILTPARWWNGEHSWSGQAKNLTLDLDRGCLCEALPDGGQARHMTVVFADGKSQLRMSGALGPLQHTGASGHLNFAVKPDNGGTALAVSYHVGGYAKGGLAETWAAPVDAVLGEQVARLKRYVETGKPD